MSVPVGRRGGCGSSSEQVWTGFSDSDQMSLARGTLGWDGWWYPIAYILTWMHYCWDGQMYCLIFWEKVQRITKMQEYLDSILSWPAQWLNKSTLTLIWHPGKEIQLFHGYLAEHAHARNVINGFRVHIGAIILLDGEIKRITNVMDSKDFLGKMQPPCMGILSTKHTQ